MSELNKKVERAIQALRAFQKKDEPYYLCYSGGKDSDTIRILAEIAGVNYELHNNHTTVDSPETVRYIKRIMSIYGDKRYDKETRTDVYGEKGFVHYPDLSIWQLIVKKLFPPTRVVRYCCSELKEKGGRGRRKVTGVRWAESKNRKDNQGIVTIIGKSKKVIEKAEEVNANFTKTTKGGVVLNTDNDASRRVVESCYRTTSTLINSIIDWSDSEVWEFLHQNGCESNPEYKCGQKRIGCIDCPLSGVKQQKSDFVKYPKYRNAYVMAFDRMLEERKRQGKDDSAGFWKDGEAVMRWWLGDDPLQITIEDYLKYLEEQEALIKDYV